MSMGLEAFRSGQGDRVILNNNFDNATGVVKAELPFGQRVVNFFKSGGEQYGTVQQRTQNREFKTAFMLALVKAEGLDIAQRAAQKHGVRLETSKPMSEKQIKLVLDEAQHLRKKFMNGAEHNAKVFLSGDQATSFATTSAAQRTAGFRDTDVNNPQLIALFKRELKQDPNYGHRPINEADLPAIAQRAINKFVAQREAAFRRTKSGPRRVLRPGPYRRAAAGPAPILRRGDDQAYPGLRAGP